LRIWNLRYDQVTHEAERQVDIGNLFETLSGAAAAAAAASTCHERQHGDNRCKEPAIFTLFPVSGRAIHVARVDGDDGDGEVEVEFA
jgi:hypothetical protein